VSFMKSWIDAVAFGLETQVVIAMRLTKIALGGPGGADECRRMFFEKIDTASSAQTAAFLALAGRKSIEVVIPNQRRRRCKGGFVQTSSTSPVGLPTSI
jgi:hypothetical protein